MIVNHFISLVPMSGVLMSRGHRSLVSGPVQSNMWLWLFVWFFFSLLASYYVFFLWRVRHFWERLKVPHTEPRFPLGDFQRGGFSSNLGVLLQKFYNEFRGERFFGIWMLTNPILIVRDPELIKTMFVKDFASFHDRGVYYNQKDDPLSAHLFNIEGAKWRNIRARLTPTFSSGKMKMMFSLMLRCGEELKAYLGRTAEEGKTVDVREVAALLMTDIISICAFGIETNSLKNPTAEFRLMGKKILEPNVRNFFSFFLQTSAPKVAEMLRMRVFAKQPADFFLEAFREVMDYREQNNVDRNDFLKLLMELRKEDKEKGAEEETLSFEDAAAQAFVFFVAGFETSSSVVQFAMYELARNPDIQEKLRKEISVGLAEHNGKPTYEGIHSIPYLDKVIDETLRKYSVVPTLQRECVQEYKIPDSDVVLPKGTIVHFPIHAIQRDEKYYPDPERFDPERFSEEQKRNRPAYAYLPFGEGPRNCVGKRFGLMQVRLALIIFLQHFRFELSEKQKEIEFDQRAFVLLPKSEICLKIKAI